MLRAVRIFIFGVKNLTVEVNAKYIKGMINNPNLQPNVTINQWIAGILLFSFKLIHVSMLKHKGINGLSRHPPVEKEPMEDSNYEVWIDHAYSFSIVLLNNHTYHIYGGCVDIRHNMHNTCFTSQTTHVPILCMYFNAICAEDPTLRTGMCTRCAIDQHQALFYYMQEALGSHR
jgi:hypothetical protein